jgi:hypothetical protein
VRDLALTPDHKLPAGEAAVIDVLGEMPVEVRELTRIEADRIGFDGGLHACLRTGQ